MSLFRRRRPTMDNPPPRIIQTPIIKVNTTMDPYLALKNKLLTLIESKCDQPITHLDLLNIINDIIKDNQKVINRENRKILDDINLSNLKLKMDNPPPIPDRIRSEPSGDISWG